MNRQKILQEVGSRLKNIREQLDYTRDEMALQCGVSSNGYAKNERGTHLPSIDALYRLSRNLGISMDWLLFEKGATFFNEREKEAARDETQAGETHRDEAAPQEGEEKSACLEEMMPDVRELLDYMARDPLLRCEVLVHFYKYRKEAGHEKQ